MNLGDSLGFTPAPGQMQEQPYFVPQNQTDFSALPDGAGAGTQLTDMQNAGIATQSDVQRA